jgi:hypothetical protein
VRSMQWQIFVSLVCLYAVIGGNVDYGILGPATLATPAESMFGTAVTWHVAVERALWALAS